MKKLRIYIGIVLFLTLSILSLPSKTVAQWWQFVGNIQFDTSATTPSYSEGMLFFDKLSKKLSFFTSLPSERVILDDTKSKSVYQVFYADNESTTGFTNISINTTSPINGVADYSVDSYPAALPDVSLNKRNLGKGNALIFEYTLTSGTAQVSVSGGGLANPVTATLTSDEKRAVIEFTPTSLVDLEIDITDLSSATGLKIDDVVLTDEPKETKSFTVKDLVKGAGTPSITSNYLTLSSLSGGGELISISNAVDSRTRVTFLQDVDRFVVNLSRQSNGAASSAIIYFRNSSGTLLEESGQTSDASIRDSMTLQNSASAGDYIEFYNDIAAPAETQLSVFAEKTREGTVYASDAVGDVVVRGEGNAGLAVLVDAPINWTQVKDTDDIWDGETFVPKETGVYTINFLANTTLSLGFNVYLWDNGVQAESVTDNDGATDVISGSITKEFIAGRSYTLRPSIGITLSNDSQLHWLNITKAASNIDNFILENPEGEFETTKDFVVSDVGSGSGNIDVMSVPLDMNYSYLVLPSFTLSASSAIGTATLDIRSGANGTGTRYKPEYISYTGSSSNTTVTLGSPFFIENPLSNTLYVHKLGTSGIVHGGETSTSIQVIKFPKSLGVDTAKEVVINRTTNGAEVKEKGKFIGGKQLYSRTYIWTGSTGTSVTSTTIDTGLTGISNVRFSATFKDSTGWYDSPYTIGTTTYVYTTLTDAGSLAFSTNGFDVLRYELTMTYTKD